MTVNNQPVQRQGDLFFTQIPVDNSSAPVYSAFTVVGARTNADAQGNDAVQQGVVKKVVPQTPETFTYDFDGNVLSDGRWNYTWDGENRLVSAASLNSAPSVAKKKLDFIYDGQSRRVSKKSYTWDGSAWTLSDSRRFLYDQFNLLAEIKDDGVIINSYAWGTDLSGSLYGAGGVGGLLIATNSSGNFYPSFDANGNILAYISNTGAVTAQFEYGPFGELLRSSGTPPCPFGFSTKYRDQETGLHYYGYRYYSSSLGRWLGRDPIEEQGGVNLYGMVKNNAVNWVDYLGKDRVVENFAGVPLHIKLYIQKNFEKEGTWSSVEFAVDFKSKLNAPIAVGAIALGRFGPLGQAAQAGIWFKGIVSYNSNDRPPGGGRTIKSNCVDDLYLDEFAKSLSRGSLPYNLVFFNCRHFVKMIENVGKDRGPQVPSILNLFGYW